MAHPNKLPSTSAITHALSDQDFGDEKHKKGEIDPPKQIVIQEASNCIKCKKCGKRNYIPMNPIEKTETMYCKCGHKVAVLAGKDYGDFLRKKAKVKALQEALDEVSGIEEIESQII